MQNDPRSKSLQGSTLTLDMIKEAQKLLNPAPPTRFKVGSKFAFEEAVRRHGGQILRKTGEPVGEFLGVEVEVSPLGRSIFLW